MKKPIMDNVERRAITNSKSLWANLLKLKLAKLKFLRDLLYIVKGGITIAFTIWFTIMVFLLLGYGSYKLFQYL